MTLVLVFKSFYFNFNDYSLCLKYNNSEGYDRIPQRIIKDGIEQLIAPLSFLFKLIYDTKAIPDQWRIAKVNPIPKKGQKMKSVTIDLFQIFLQLLRSLKN